MSDFGKIKWETENSHEKPDSTDLTKELQVFFNTCEAIAPANSDLIVSSKEIREKRKAFKNECDKFVKDLSQQPLLAVFMDWVREQCQRSPNNMIDLADKLVKNRLIGILDSSGRTWTVEKSKNFDLLPVLEAIRSHREWPIRTREEAVKCYLSFMEWLGEITFGYMQPIEDPNIARTKHHLLPYPVFIQFLSALPNEKAELVAKLLYFSHQRTLEEILGIDIPNISYERSVIHFALGDEPYPIHIMNDIKALAGPRTSGRLFTGRQDAPLNDATIFRNFNEAAKKCGLGSSLSPKKLTATLDNQTISRNT